MKETIKLINELAEKQSWIRHGFAGLLGYYNQMLAECSSAEEEISYTLEEGKDKYGCRYTIQLSLDLRNKQLSVKKVFEYEVAVEFKPTINQIRDIISKLPDALEYFTKQLENLNTQQDSIIVALDKLLQRTRNAN